MIRVNEGTWWILFSFSYFAIFLDEIKRKTENSCFSFVIFYTILILLFWRKKSHFSREIGSFVLIELTSGFFYMRNFYGFIDKKLLLWIIKWWKSQWGKAWKQKKKNETNSTSITLFETKSCIYCLNLIPIFENPIFPTIQNQNHESSHL